MRTSILSLSLLIPLTACTESTEGEPVWDRSDDAVVLEASSCCGYVTNYARANYVPEARVWGDGRIVWTRYDEDGGRTVLEDNLPEQDIAGLIELAVSGGFFDWDDEYVGDEPALDLPPTSLTINTVDDSHTVVDYGFSGPALFRHLHELLSDGLGAEGDDYEAERARLRTAPADELMVDAPPTWDANISSLDLASAKGGAWLEGATLDYAWELVNASPWYPVAKQGGQQFLLELQVPELTVDPK